MRIDGYAEDVFEMRKEEWFSEWVENKKLPCCDYCRGERKRALLSIIGAYRLCESCATLSVEERNEVKNSQLEECPDSKVSWDGYQLNVRCTKSPVNHYEECPDYKYEGSLWEYCEEGFRVSWDGHQWDARCTNPLGFQSIFEDVDPVAMEIEGFWNIIEYGGCISTHEKPKPLKRNPNKAPEIKVPWDPYSV